MVREVLRAKASEGLESKKVCSEVGFVFDQRLIGDDILHDYTYVIAVMNVIVVTDMNMNI